MSISGGGRDREPGLPGFSDLRCAAHLDSSSADLFLQAAGGKSLGTATVHFMQTGGVDVKHQVYLILELSEAMIMNYVFMGTNGAERPQITFDINFTKMSFQYNSFDGSKINTGTKKNWDLMAGAAF